MGYANQKTIRIDKPLHYPPKMFTQIGKDELGCAVRDLSPSALSLWLYFMQNNAGFEDVYSKKAFENWADVKEATARNAMRELEEKGYIKIVSSTYCEFHSVPSDSAPGPDLGFK